MQGHLHIYHPKRNLLLFEHTPFPSPTPPNPPPNTLLFIGGMYDNFLTPSYTRSLSTLFPRQWTQSWGVMHAQLSSAGRSFGTSSLSKDVDEIGAAVTYIRSVLRPATPDAPVVLLGHSTGCQDILTYLYAVGQRPGVHGAVLQAPVSDRDAVNMAARRDGGVRMKLVEAVKVARETEVGRRRSVVVPLDLTGPLMGPAPLSVDRFLSLVSPDSPGRPGLDDLFSVDAEDGWLRRTFGGVGERGVLKGKKEVLVLMMEKDEGVDEDVDKEVVLRRWKGAMEGTGATIHAESCVVKGANHGMERDEWAREVVFRGIVLRYLDEMVGGVDEVAWKVWRDEKERLTAEGKDGNAVDVKL